MSFNADAVTLTLLALLAVLIIGIFGYIVSVKAGVRRAKRDSAAICATIIDYFRRSGVQVSADCTRMAGRKAFTAVVESEPMKRFRLSHIIEMTVREHVRKSCGLELEKIYWRFPIKEATQAAAAPNEADAKPQGEPEGRKRDESSDEYINEGLEHYRHIPRPEVTELPWETFEQMATVGKDKPEGA